PVQVTLPPSMTRLDGPPPPPPLLTLIPSTAIVLIVTLPIRPVQPLDSRSASGPGLMSTFTVTESRSTGWSQVQPKKLPHWPSEQVTEIEPVSVDACLGAAKPDPTSVRIASRLRSAADACIDLFKL